MNGPVAQRIRHLTTDQGIPGSNPGRVVFFFFFLFFFFFSFCVPLYAWWFVLFVFICFFVSVFSLSFPQSNHVASSTAKLALLCDWLAYHPEKDNIMNIGTSSLMACDCKLHCLGLLWSIENVGWVLTWRWAITR